ncbi:response regulator [Massilia niabensis]|uniref:Response regulator n=1 Tax=Massilia niabensis TaxID=544910 RepID=A0ABW0L968_9BURK
MLPNTCGKQSVRVLLADRSDETRDLFATLFAGMGYEVATVKSIGDALYCLPQFQPDAVFTAIFLPDGSGFDLCAALRRMPGTAKALIVAITGHQSPDSARLAQEAGFDHYFVKPVKLATILDTLQDLGARKHDTVPGDGLQPLSSPHADQAA